jgi:TetR/AcrR family transcriptional regulator, regulator of autoinduction and epiphytic fitness
MNLPHRSAVVRVSFKEQMLQAREDAIIQTVNRLLAEKGFDAMTVDEVAMAVGIAKASLYKHFPSKEDLAAAAMVRLMRRAQAFLDGLHTDASAMEKVKAVARWTIELQLAGEMPHLPSQNSTLRATLIGNKDYMDGLMDVSDRLGNWIETAQKEGAINPALPPLVVLYTVYARACDPVLEFLKSSGLYSEAQVADYVMSACFDGLNAK